MKPYWKIAFRWGLAALAMLVVSVWSYGLFRPFSFWHAFTPAGLESAFMHVAFFGPVFGPWFLVGGAVVGVLVNWLRHRP